MFAPLQNYLVMTSYAERLTAAMAHAGVKTAALCEPTSLMAHSRSARNAGVVSGP